MINSPLHHRQHRMTHTGEKTYACPLCQRGFIQAGPFRRHVLKVHGIDIPRGGHGGNLRTFIEKHQKDTKAS